MPSVQVANKDWNREVKKVDRPIVKQQNQEVVGKVEQPVKMPCNPSSASQSPPLTDGALHTIHHENKIQSNGSTVAMVAEAKSKMAKEAYASFKRRRQPYDPKTSSGKMEDLKVAVDTKPRQATKTDGRKEFVPEILALLNKDFTGHRCLEKQRSVSSSYEKETHVLTHTVSAPGALSVVKESLKEDQVFGEEQSEEKSTGDQSKKDRQDGKQVDVETKPQGSTKQNNIGNKDGQKDNTEVRDVEKQDIGKDDSRQEHSEKSSSDDKSQADKVDAGMKEAAEDVPSDAGDRKKEKVKDEEEAKKTVEDIDSLTQKLQTKLKLDDGEKAEESNSKGGEVSKFANDHIRETSGEASAGPKLSGLRARGIDVLGRPDGKFTSNYGFVVSHQSQPSRIAAQPPLMQNQQHFQTNVLPPFNKAFMPGVVNPPGQGNFMPIYMRHPGTVHRVQGPAITQSKQGQLAQNALSPPLQNQAYPLNDLSKGGLSFQPNQQKIPAESTGQPVEVTWPLTPDSIADMIDSMTSDDESVKSPMENEETVQSGGLMDYLPSPQSPWQTATQASAFSSQDSPYAEQTALSVASSLSPQHSPYQDPQGSPFHQVPDTSPLTPDSNIGSPGGSLPPESPTYNLQCTMGMTAGIMTVQDRSSLAPRAPNKQELEEKKKIQEIERMLMTPSDPSQSPPQFFQGFPQQERHFQTNYQVDPYTHMSPVSPPTTAVPTSFVTHRAPSQVYPSGVTPYIGELETCRAWLAKHSVEDVLFEDKDKDTILHLAICKDQVALSIAIIERIRAEKRSLDMLNNLRQTPLYLAVACKLPILVEFLLMYGASLAIGNNEGNTPLHAAAVTGNTEAVKTIIRCMSYSCCSDHETSALFNATNCDGKTALMLAVEAHSKDVNCVEIVKDLLMRYTDPMSPDCRSGKTALHYAVELQKIDLIYIILDECQDASKLVNAKMYNGNTALHLIVGRAIPEELILHIVGMLMSSGANVSLSNDANEKPCDLVRRENCQVKHHLHGREHHKR